MRHLLPLTLVLWLGSGCFVLEELDKADALIDQHSPRNRQRQEEAAKKKARKAEKEKGSLLADVQGRFASLVDWVKDTAKGSPPERDADDTVVRCQISGRLHFTRKSDCQIRGGTVI